MARAREDPSGPKVGVTIRLAPARIAELDRLVAETGLNRSRLLARLVAEAAASGRRPGRVIRVRNSTG